MGSQIELQMKDAPTPKRKLSIPESPPKLGNSNAVSHQLLLETYQSLQDVYNVQEEILRGASFRDEEVDLLGSTDVMRVRY